MNPIEQGFSPAARMIMVAGAFVIVIAGMQAASSLVSPFLLAIFIAIIASPPLRILRQMGLPNSLAMLVVVLILMGFGGVLVILVTGSLGGFEANLPDYQDRLKQMTEVGAKWLDGMGVHISREALQTYVNPAKAMGFAGQVISGLSGILTNALLILLTVIFILLEASNLPSKLRCAFQYPEESAQRMRHVLASVNRYMGLKTLTSLGTGVAVWVLLTLMHLDFPVLWAAVAFLLNFVPTIGSILAAIPAILLAVVQLGMQEAIMIAAGFIFINTMIGNVLEPRIMGQGLGLSTLVVFISLIFWGWVLGPAGMFLSVPLTMALKIALDADPQTRPIAILLGPEIHGNEHGTESPCEQNA